jgi:hypothetical protein
MPLKSSFKQRAFGSFFTAVTRRLNFKEQHVTEIMDVSCDNHRVDKTNSF